MATVVIKHNTKTNAPANPLALVDGVTWDNDPHVVTGLDQVDNTSDVNKPVSTAQAAADALVASNAAAASSTAIAAEAALARNASNLTSGTVPAGRLPAAGQLPGTTTNDNAAAGKVGEFISSTVASGSAVSLTTTIPANVTSISLTAGDWDVWFDAVFIGNASTVVTNQFATISLTSATLNFTPGSCYMFGSGTTGLYSNTGVGVSANAGPARLSLSATTTIFGVVQSLFSTSTTSAFGLLRARRAR